MNATSETKQTRRRRPRCAAAAAAGLTALLLGSGIAVATSPDGARAAVASTSALQTVQAPDQQVKALQAQVKALQAQVTALLRRVGELEDYNDCESVVPIGRFGDTSPEAAFGYLWVDSNGEFATSALDYVEPSDFDPTYDEWFTLVEPGCVDVSARIPAARAVAR